MKIYEENRNTRIKHNYKLRFKYENKFCMNYIDIIQNYLLIGQTCRPNDPDILICGLGRIRSLSTRFVYLENMNITHEGIKPMLKLMLCPFDTLKEGLFHAVLLTTLKRKTVNKTLL